MQIHIHIYSEKDKEPKAYMLLLSRGWVSGTKPCSVGTKTGKKSISEMRKSCNVENIENNTQKIFCDYCNWIWMFYILKEIKNNRCHKMY